MSDKPKRKGRHGGARPGAGRRPKPHNPTVLDRSDVDLLLADAAPDMIESEAQRHARLAVSALLKQLLTGKSEAARVTAANRILDRGYGKPAVDIGGDAAMLPFAPRIVHQVLPSVELRDEARKYARLAIEVLSRIAQFGQSETAKMAATTALLDRGFGTVGAAMLPDELKQRPLGKKEQAAIAAELAATGPYATPKPPKAYRRDDDESKGGAGGA